MTISDFSQEAGREGTGKDRPAAEGRGTTLTVAKEMILFGKSISSGVRYQILLKIISCKYCLSGCLSREEKQPCTVWKLHIESLIC